MQVQRRIEEVKSRRLTIDLPETFVNHKVEILVLTVDEEPVTRRCPHPDIAGKVKIVGNVLESAPESDWDLPR